MKVGYLAGDRPGRAIPCANQLGLWQYSTSLCEEISKFGVPPLLQDSPVKKLSKKALLLLFSLLFFVSLPTFSKVEDRPTDPHRPMCVRRRENLRYLKKKKPSPLSFLLYRSRFFPRMKVWENDASQVCYAKQEKRREREERGDNGEEKKK